MKILRKCFFITSSSHANASNLGQIWVRGVGGINLHTIQVKKPAFYYIKGRLVFFPFSIILFFIMGLSTSD